MRLLAAASVRTDAEMVTMMKRLLLAAALLGACDRKGADDNLTTRRPATFDAWMPADAVAAVAVWQRRPFRRGAGRASAALDAYRQRRIL